MDTNLIPKAVSYAKNVNAIENHSYQEWLRQIIKREDEMAWAQSEKEEPEAAPEDVEEMTEDEPVIRLGVLTALLP